MPSLSEFQALLSTNLEQAMKDYVVINHTESLDGDVMRLQACSERGVVFDFEGPNQILIRAKREGETAHQTLWYLPWMWDGLSKADLEKTLRRRYSFRVQKARKVDDGETLYYGGNKAWIFGARDSEGCWSFVAQEMDEFKGATKGMGLKPLL